MATLCSKCLPYLMFMKKEQCDQESIIHSQKSIILSLAFEKQLMQISKSLEYDYEMPPPNILYPPKPQNPIDLINNKQNYYDEDPGRSRPGFMAPPGTGAHNTILSIRGYSHSPTRYPRQQAAPTTGLPIRQLSYNRGGSSVITNIEGMRQSNNIFYQGGTYSSIGGSRRSQRGSKSTLRFNMAGLETTQGKENFVGINQFNLIPANNRSRDQELCTLLSGDSRVKEKNVKYGEYRDYVNGYEDADSELGEGKGESKNINRRKTKYGLSLNNVTTTATTMNSGIHSSTLINTTDTGTASGVNSGVQQLSLDMHPVRERSVGNQTSEGRNNNNIGNIEYKDIGIGTRTSTQSKAKNIDYLQSMEMRECNMNNKSTQKYSGAASYLFKTKYRSPTDSMNKKLQMLAPSRNKGLFLSKEGGYLASRDASNPSSTHTLEGEALFKDYAFVKKTIDFDLTTGRGMAPQILTESEGGGFSSSDGGELKTPPFLKGGSLLGYREKHYRRGPLVGHRRARTDREVEQRTRGEFEESVRGEFDRGMREIADRLTKSESSSMQTSILPHQQSFNIHLLNYPGQHAKSPSFNLIGRELINQKGGVFSSSEFTSNPPHLTLRKSPFFSPLNHSDLQVSNTTSSHKNPYETNSHGNPQKFILFNQMKGNPLASPFEQGFSGGVSSNNSMGGNLMNIQDLHTGGAHQVDYASVYFPQPQAFVTTSESERSIQEETSNLEHPTETLGFPLPSPVITDNLNISSGTQPNHFQLNYLHNPHNLQNTKDIQNREYTQNTQNTEYTQNAQRLKGVSKSCNDMASKIRAFNSFGMVQVPHQGDKVFGDNWYKLVVTHGDSFISLEEEGVLFKIGIRYTSPISVKQGGEIVKGIRVYPNIEHLIELMKKLVEEGKQKAEDLIILRMSVNGTYINEKHKIYYFTSVKPVEIIQLK